MQRCGFSLLRDLKPTLLIKVEIKSCLSTKIYNDFPPLRLKQFYGNHIQFVGELLKKLDIKSLLISWVPESSEIFIREIE